MIEDHKKWSLIWIIYRKTGGNIMQIRNILIIMLFSIAPMQAGIWQGLRGFFRQQPGVVKNSNRIMQQARNVHYNNAYRNYSNGKENQAEDSSFDDFLRKKREENLRKIEKLGNKIDPLQHNIVHKTNKYDPREWLRLSTELASLRKEIDENQRELEKNLKNSICHDSLMYASQSMRTHLNVLDDVLRRKKPNVLLPESSTCRPEGLWFQDEGTQLRYLIDTAKHNNLAEAKKALKDMRLVYTEKSLQNLSAAYADQNTTEKNTAQQVHRMIRNQRIKENFLGISLWSGVIGICLLSVFN